jgi:hypothetical protein
MKSGGLLRKIRTVPLLFTMRSPAVAGVLLLTAPVPPATADSLDVDLAEQIRVVLDIVEQEACSEYLLLQEDTPGLTPAGTVNLVLTLRTDGGFTVLALEPDPGLEPLALALDSLLDTLRVSLSQPLSTAVTVEMPILFTPAP